MDALFKHLEFPVPKGATHVLINTVPSVKGMPTGMHWDKRTKKIHFSFNSQWGVLEMEETALKSMGYSLRPVNLDLENK